MNTKTDKKDEEKKKDQLPAAAPTGGALAVVEDFGLDAGAGMENVDRDEYRIPFLRILQKNSPQVNPPEAGGLAGAVAGSILNTGTNQVYDGKKGLIIAPVYRDHNFVEFVHRDAGGGLVGVHSPDDPLVLELRAKQGKFGKLRPGAPPAGGQDDLRNQISEAFYLYSLVWPPEAVPFRAIVGFSSSQIKKYQDFIQRAMGFEYLVERDGKKVAVKPPIWAHTWHLTTVFEKNKKGDYYNWSLTLSEREADGRESQLKSFVRVSDPRYQAAKEFADLIKGGHAKVDYTATREPGDGSEEEMPM